MCWLVGASSVPCGSLQIECLYFVPEWGVLAVGGEVGQVLMGG
jgi:hypothetical protein